MKYKFYLLICFFSFTINSLAQKTTLKEPDISFSIIPTGKSTQGNGYEVYFKSSEDFDSTYVTGLLITIMNSKTSSSRILSVSNNFTDKLKYFSFEASKSQKEYNFHSFYIDYKDYIPFVLKATKNKEILLFRFFTDGNCGETLRLLRGVSQFSKHKQPDKINDGVSGAIVDDVPIDQNMQNSISLAYQGQVFEGYKGTNYGSASNCPGNKNARQNVDSTSSEFINSALKYNLLLTESANGQQNKYEELSQKPICTLNPNLIIEGVEMQIITKNIIPTQFKIYNAAMQNWNLTVQKFNENLYNVKTNSQLNPGFYYIQMTDESGKMCVIKFLKM